MVRVRVRALAAVLAVLGVGCSDPGATATPGSSAPGKTSSAIVGSKPSDPTQDAVVMLVFLDPATGRQGICTAVLLAPRLVLTARHCVSVTDLDVTCGTNGLPVDGGEVRANHAPGQLYVFTGPTRPGLDPATWKPAGRGLEILDDGSKNLCNHDLALVLLEQPVPGATIAPIRLDGDTTAGERLLTVGWGVTSEADEPRTRQQRSGVTVTRIGPDETGPVLTPNEFSFDESICLGDSGGPIFAEATGAVVGVVSRGGNGTTTGDLLSSCTRAVNLGPKITPFRELVSRGLARAGAEARVEVKPPASADADDGGCGVARGRGAKSAWWALVVAVALTVMRRRARS
jgi:hypothetical protein